MGYLRILLVFWFGLRMWGRSSIWHVVHYLVHITVFYFVLSPFLLLLCIVASAPLVFLVELPLERWRDGRLRATIVKSEIRSAGA